MVEGKTIHGLYCPECGGTLALAEGQLVVNCPYCGVSSLLTGLTGGQEVWRLRVRRAVEREGALKAVKRFLSRLDRAPTLKRQAVVEECFPVYLPYWRAWIRGAAWLFGRQEGEDSTYPVDKFIAEDFAWTDAACDVSEFGLQGLKHVRGAGLELYDRETLQREALVFEPVESSTEAMGQAKDAFLKRARRRAGLSETRFERVQFLQEKLSLIYYPLWVARYLYQGRSYQVAIDGVTGRVVHGRAPGNLLVRALGFVVAMLVGATLPVDLLMMLSLGARELRTASVGMRLLSGVMMILYIVALGCIVFGLSAFVTRAGYVFLRSGGERVVGKKRKFLPDLMACSGCGGWSLVSLVWLLLTLAWPGRLKIIIPGVILATFAGLGLGWIVVTADSPTHGEPSSDEVFQEEEAKAAPVVPVSEPSLLPLRCPNCQTPVDAREGEVAYLCQTCGWGLELTAKGLRRVEVSFATPQPHPRARTTSYLPFWVFDGQVQVRRREAVRQSLLKRDAGPSADHGEMWQHPRLFYVPAFRASLKSLQSWGVALTRGQPNYPPGDECELRGCIYTEEEARKLAEFIFLSIEARKPDVLQEIDYSLTLTAPRLLVVPCFCHTPARR